MGQSIAFKFFLLTPCSLELIVVILLLVYIIKYVCCCSYLLQLLILMIVMMNDGLQVTPESTQHGHDTLGLIALDCSGNITAGKWII